MCATVFGKRKCNATGMLSFYIITLFFFLIITKKHETQKVKHTNCPVLDDYSVTVKLCAKEEFYVHVLHIINSEFNALSVSECVHRILTSSFMIVHSKIKSKHEIRDRNI
jgi:hypothetical protein